MQETADQPQYPFVGLAANIAAALPKVAGNHVARGPNRMSEPMLAKMPNDAQASLGRAMQRRADGGEDDARA